MSECCDCGVEWSATNVRGPRSPRCPECRRLRRGFTRVTWGSRRVEIEAAGHRWNPRLGVAKDG